MLMRIRWLCMRIKHTCVVRLWRARSSRRRATLGGEGVPPEEMAEELSWEGGPGFNVALACETLAAHLSGLISQGFAFSAAAVGDGFWDGATAEVGRTALVDSSEVFGGRLRADDIVGGNRNTILRRGAGSLTRSSQPPAERTAAIYVLCSTPRHR